jgi:hypothetical protein
MTQHLQLTVPDRVRDKANRYPRLTRPRRWNIGCLTLATIRKMSPVSDYRTDDRHSDR